MTQPHKTTVHIARSMLAAFGVAAGGSLDALGDAGDRLRGAALGAALGFRSVKEECLSKVVLFGERSLRRTLSEYVDHYHAERNHQGEGQCPLVPAA